MKYPGEHPITHITFSTIPHLNANEIEPIVLPGRRSLTTEMVRSNRFGGLTDREIGSHIFIPARGRISYRDWLAKNHWVEVLAQRKSRIFQI